MIERIGVVCQDRNSYGFLEGIKRRLNCRAELVEPTTGALAKSTTMTRRQARIAAKELQKKGADLIVRFTDADRNRWQDIIRGERGVFPHEFDSIVVCGVAVENTEHLLALDRAYIGAALGISDVGALAPQDLTGAIKGAIARSRSSDEPVWEVTARLVAQAPAGVFREWLKSDDALRDFYHQCRAAALRADCTVPNEDQ